MKCLPHETSLKGDFSMRKTTQLHEAEDALHEKSRQLAEAQLKLVSAERLAATITDYVEWRAFAYWVRLIVETEGCVSSDMASLLEGRCPGFLKYAEDHRRAKVNARAYLWLRLNS